MMQTVASNPSGPLRDHSEMSLKFAMIFLFVTLTGCASSLDLPVDQRWIEAYPHVVLTDGDVKLIVALPDEEVGFNRATRFDRAGLVVFAGRNSGEIYFSALTTAGDHNPLLDDHVAGTAGEFGIHDPLGYEVSEVGGLFIKPGVGVLRRTSSKPYFFRAAYPLVDAGLWEVASSRRSVVMRQVLSSEDGWGYEYETRVSLLRDRVGFTIERTLANTGQHRIRTDHYSHNFVTLGGDGVHPGTKVQFGHAHSPSGEMKLRSLATFDGQVLRVVQELGSSSLYLPLIPVASEAGERWSVAVNATGRKERLVIEQQPSPNMVVLFALSSAISPEPFILIDLEPGEAMDWRTEYLFESMHSIKNSVVIGGAPS